MPAVLVLVLTMAAHAQAQKLPSDDSTFMVAVTVGDVALVKKMLDEKRGDVNGISGAEYTWLYLAADRGNKAMIELLLARGADVHTHGDGKNAAVFAAAKMGHKDVVKLLLDKDADVDALGVDGGTRLVDRTPLQVAASLEITRILVEHDANVNVRDKYRDQTLLHKLVSAAARDQSGNKERRQEYVDLIKLLIAHKADVHARDSSGKTPLHIAMHGNLELTKLLLDAGASVHERLFEEDHSRRPRPPPSAGNTPLHWAAETGRLDLAKLLLENGADVNAKNQASQTPLHFAARANQIELAKFLFASRAKINSRDTSGRTPLHEATLKGHKEMVQWLLEQGGRK
jgi:ankyrin repeat protein